MECVILSLVFLWWWYGNINKHSHLKKKNYLQKSFSFGNYFNRFRGPFINDLRDSWQLWRQFCLTEEGGYTFCQLLIWGPNRSFFLMIQPKNAVHAFHLMPLLVVTRIFDDLLLRHFSFHRSEDSFLYVGGKKLREK